MLCFSGLLAAGTVPLMRAMQAVHGPVAAGALVVLALAALSFYTSIAAIVKAELFPPQVRALGVGLAYAVGNAVFGGSAESAALWLKSIGHESAFYWYVTALMLVGFAVSARLPRRGAGYLP
jgi:MHS family alpha-ketoglutarate permease-like MFS transporter